MLDKLKTKAQQKADELKAGATGSYEASATAPNTAEVASSSQRLSYPLDDADYKARVIFSVLATETTGIGDSFNQIASLADSKAKAVKSQVQDKVAEVRANKEMEKFASRMRMK